MKRVNCSWNDVYDPTGYLFSFAKSLACAVKNSPYSEFAEDIIASSGFAFRMWLNPELCPSAMSIWNFDSQPEWILTGGFNTAFVSCCWQPEEALAEARSVILPKIKDSIDRGIPVIAWDIGVLEWGLITGYDEDNQKLAALCISGSTDNMDYATLGNREMPMLNVVTITGKSDKSQSDIISDTLKLAKSHLLGEEWCDENNKKGLDVYSSLISLFETDNTQLTSSWNMEYYLGTFCSCKYYAWKFFEKYGLTELSAIYKTVYECWKKAFDLKKSGNGIMEKETSSVAELLKTAETLERKAVKIF